MATKTRRNRYGNDTIATAVRYSGHVRVDITLDDFDNTRAGSPRGTFSWGV